MAQHRYILAVVVPPEVSDTLAALRDAYGMPPWQPVVPFHITLVPPFNTALPADAVASLVEVVGATPSFPVTLDGFGRFDHATSILYVDVANSDALSDLARRLRDALSTVTSGHYDEGRFEFTPHVTLTGKAPRAVIDRYIARLANTRFHAGFTCARFVLMELDEKVRAWHTLRDFVFTQ